MTGVLIVLAALSAVGGFLALPHFLEPQLPLPEVRPELAAFESTLLYVSVALAFAGLAGAAFLFGRNAERADRLRRHFPALHRLLSGKYFVDEAYEQFIDRPLFWISERVFLQFGDRKIFDGTLHGIAALGRRTAGVLARVQNGDLHLYAFLVLVGIVATVAWSWHHG
jgi:NADH-quinone oxidoreductase subunit L